MAKKEIVEITKNLNRRLYMHGKGHVSLSHVINVIVAGHDIHVRRIGTQEDCTEEVLLACVKEIAGNGLRKEALLKFLREQNGN